MYVFSDIGFREGCDLFFLRTLLLARRCHDRSYGGFTDSILPSRKGNEFVGIIEIIN